MEKQNFEETGADELDIDHKVPENVDGEWKIPDRLSQMFRMKGVDIKTKRIKRVGGGGKCGVNCVSIHTTGNEHNATEIRKNI